MTFYQLSKQLDKNAMNFVNKGDLKRAYAAMEVAAIIRRMDSEIQKSKFTME